MQMRKYLEPTLAEFGSHKHFQHIQINLQENVLKSWLVSLFASSIKKAIPEKQWGHYLISNQDILSVPPTLARLLSCWLIR